MANQTPTWRTLQYVHIGTLTIAVQYYGGVDWILLPQLAKELGINVSRLLGAIAGSANRPHVLCVSFPELLQGGKPVQAFVRTAAPVVAGRLRTGTNNRLLRFVNHADEIAGLDQPDVLLRQAERVKRALDAQIAAQRKQRERAKQFVVAYDTAKKVGHEKARAQFISQSGASASMYSGFMKGAYPTVAAKTARAAIEKRDGEFKAPRLRRGRRPLLTTEVIDAIRAVLKRGIRTHAEIGATFGVSEATITDIARGQYRTESAKQAAATKPDPRARKK